MKLLGLLLLCASCSMIRAARVHSMACTEFATFIDQQLGLTLVEFYQTPCTRCQTLEPELEKVAVGLAENDDTSIAMVDCKGIENRDMCFGYGAYAKPTLLVFRGSKVVDTYQGGDSSESIAWYLTRLKQPPVMNMTGHNFDALIRDEHLTIVAFVVQDNKPFRHAFASAAKKLHGLFQFGISSDTVLAQVQNITMPAIVAYREGALLTTMTMPSVDPVTLTVGEVEDFVSSVDDPLIGELDFDTFDKYRSKAPALAWIFAESKEDRKNLAASLHKLASKYQGVVTFGTIDASRYGGITGRLGLEYGRWPALAVEDIGNEAVFPLDQDEPLTEGVIEDFIETLRAEELLEMGERGAAAASPPHTAPAGHQEL